MEPTNNLESSALTADKYVEKPVDSITPEEGKEALRSGYKKYIYGIIALILSALATVALFFYALSDQSPLFEVKDFETCRDAGYTVQESDPMTCVTPEGVRFIEIK